MLARTSLIRPLTLLLAFQPIFHSKESLNFHYQIAYRRTHLYCRYIFLVISYVEIRVSLQAGFYTPSCSCFQVHTVYPFFDSITLRKARSIIGVERQQSLMRVWASHREDQAWGAKPALSVGMMANKMEIIPSVSTWYLFLLFYGGLRAWQGIAWH